MSRIPTLVLLFAVGLGACTAAQTQPGEFRDRNLITHEELNERAFNDAYHAVETLRSNWLRTRGVDSIHKRDHVAVIMNNIRLGDPTSLRQISTREIVYIRFYDAASASARWGRDLRNGVIYVSTERS
jgi:hypothetical protein